MEYEGLRDACQVVQTKERKRRRVFHCWSKGMTIQNTAQIPQLMPEARDKGVQETRGSELDQEFLPCALLDSTAKKDRSFRTLRNQPTLCSHCGVDKTQQWLSERFLL
ncbi:hypothetical protein AVEN_125120-1 [Araneus ventricosus]|uniref:Uncharacterized protein n=1 Tax=Araneus ventricosus TaxID=182803 RepID=A0A4Y2FR18_ARAVE|nr:hypothetical protein AVEN_125120-1 [Araneus ventricosus]